tara:strand:- start:342 stop:539 length:198 start_codon:yes stop_codon:yes gene_type:complete
MKCPRPLVTEKIIQALNIPNNAVPVLLINVNFRIDDIIKNDKKKNDIEDNREYRIILNDEFRSIS